MYIEKLGLVSVVCWYYELLC